MYGDGGGLLGMVGNDEKVVNTDVVSDEIDLEALGNLFSNFKYDFTLNTKSIDKDSIELKDNIQRLKEHLDILSTGKVTPALSETGESENSSRNGARSFTREISRSLSKSSLGRSPSGIIGVNDKSAKDDDRIGLSMPRPSSEPAFRKGFPSAREKAKLRGTNSMWGIANNGMTWQEELINVSNFTR